jgi:hypothetical protein
VIISGPDALLGFIILIISIISSVVMTMSRRKLSVLSSISGRGTFVSSNEEIFSLNLFYNVNIQPVGRLHM